jgi:tRNA(fMet)-specific endonuclease VapC
MDGTFLLDTNIVIAYFNEESSIRERLTTNSGITFLAPSIVMGELYFGAYKSVRKADNLAQIEDFLTISRVLECDNTTAQQYGQIKQLLETKGRPIPENDIWIAAVARQHSLTLVSRDEHFSVVDGLAVEQW